MVMKSNYRREIIQTKHPPKNYLASPDGTFDFGIGKGHTNFYFVVVKGIPSNCLKDAEIHGFHQLQRSAEWLEAELRIMIFRTELLSRLLRFLLMSKIRPRVVRMEMEERIQKLAKQLHTKDMNIPGWQFSKMMHSAKIRFTDHSILRVVQILGAFGNWGRVFRVVECLQSHERLKSLKCRYY